MNTSTPRTDAVVRNLHEGDPFAYREMVGHARYLEIELNACRLALAQSRDSEWTIIPTWIDPQQQLPDDETTVLIRLIGDSGPVWIGYHDGEAWRYADAQTVTNGRKVTGWMHLPEP